MIALLLSCLFIVYSPNIIKAQSSPTIVNLPLTFHDYSLLLKDQNNSLYVYDGADGAPPNQASAAQVNLDAQISGQRDGWNYWSAIAMWVVKLPSDLHVQGTVTMRVYISSTFKLSGLFSGGGYGMGLVDIDENNLEIKEFITEAPYTIGGNPFTSTPTQYSLSVNVDYVFKRGHSIGFAVGLGATVQGFSATVHFGSSDRNSGVTLPVEDLDASYSFTADNNGVAHNIKITSTSAISNCQFDSSTTSIQFKAQGINYTTGRCNVYIPKALMQPPFKVTSGLQVIQATVTDSSDYYQLFFNHTRNPEPITITASAASPQPTTAPTQPATMEPTASPPIPELSALTVLLAVFVMTALLAFILTKKRSSRQY